jgi:hypothetical protein
LTLLKSPIFISGFEAGVKKVKLLQVIGLTTGLDPKKDIRYLKEYKSVKEITIPTAYIIPKAFWNIMDLLKATKSHLRG